MAKKKPDVKLDEDFLPRAKKAMAAAKAPPIFGEAMVPRRTGMYDAIDVARLVRLILLSTKL